MLPKPARWALSGVPRWRTGTASSACPFEHMVLMAGGAAVNTLCVRVPA